VEHLQAALPARGRRVVVADDGEATDDVVREMVEVLTLMCGRLYGQQRAAQLRCAGGGGCQPGSRAVEVR
jgi:predicted site-specific integrase-resolvase